MLTGQSKAVIFFCTTPFGGVWRGGEGAAGLQISWILVFVPCSHHVLQGPQTIPQPVPDSTTLFYTITFAKTIGPKKTLDFFFLLLAV